MAYFGDNKQFNEHLEAYLRTESNEQREAIEEEVWREYGVERAIFVLDMAGFSRLTEAHGIIRYLSSVRQMQLAVLPILGRYDGELTKFEADNCFAHFPDTSAAIQAAIALNIALGAMNIVTADELDIHVSIGIDFGRVLLIDQAEYFGSAVNLASKLGEDIADSGEILVTDTAMSLLPEDSGVRSEPASYSISGINIQAHKIQF